MVRTRSRSFRRLLVIALLLVALVLVWKARNYQRRYTAAEARKASLPIPVSASRAKVSKLETTVGAAGQVLQYKTVTLTSRISAKIHKVLVNVGDTIQSGALLVEDERGPLRPRWSPPGQKWNRSALRRQKAPPPRKSRWKF
jgi:multidrug efflux pump subunit AcrA (membrane-fusion protein)